MPRTEARIDLAAIRHNVATLRDATSAEVMAVVKADGYGHGLLPSRTRRRRGGGDLARHGDRVRGARAARGRDRHAHPVLALDAGRGRGDRRGRRRRHRPERQQPVAVGRRQRCRGTARAARPRPPQDRHRAVAQRCVRRGLARPRRRCGEGRARGRGRGVEPLRLRRRAGSSDDRPSDQRIPRRARRRRGGRRASGGAASGELRGHAHAARRALRPRPARHRGVRPDARAAGERLRARPGDDPARVDRVGETGRCRRGRVVRAHLHDRPRDDARARPARLRRRRPAARHEHRTGRDQRPPVHDQRPGLHGPDRRGRRRSPCRPLGILRCCGVPGRTASHSRRTGPTPSTPSTTSSSRASGRGSRAHSSDEARPRDAGRHACVRRATSNDPATRRLARADRSARRRQDRARARHRQGSWRQRQRRVADVRDRQGAQRESAARPRRCLPSRRVSPRWTTWTSTSTSSTR